MEGTRICCYPSHNLDHELTNFINVWLLVVLCFCYAYFSLGIIPCGIPRLLSYTPIFTLFLALPLYLHSMHLGGTTAFFVAWLANFKLALLAFGDGPLSHARSLPKFLATGCFPINIQPVTIKKGHSLAYNYGIKCLLVAAFVNLYRYSDRIHPNVILVIYGFHTYFMLELVLAAVASFPRALLGVELESQFKQPYLSTSLQDFWGRRWNIMVSRILHPTVYCPTVRASARLVGRKWAPLIAVFATFLVSGLMHELIFYYLGRARPTWAITWFFILHAVSLMVEIGIKKVVTWRLPAVVSMPLTVGYVVVTGLLLFIPELFYVNADIRAFDEYARLATLGKGVVGTLSEILKSRKFSI